MSQVMPFLFHPKARKEISDIGKNDRLRIWDKINELSVNCRPDGYRHVAGQPNCLRIRVGDYRITYTCQNNLVYVKTILGRGDDIYETSKRRS